MRTVRWINDWHLGDCVYHTHFMRKVQEVNPDIRQEFAFRSKHRHEIEVLNNGVADLISYDGETTPVNFRNSMIDTWVGHEVHRSPHNNYPVIYLNWWKQLCQWAKLNCPFQSIDDVVNDDVRLNIENDFLYKPDVLVINCDPGSHQWDYDKMSFAKFFCKNKMELKFFFVRECGMNLLRIGQFASKCKYIVGIDTGPMSTALNKYSLANCKGIYICHKYNTFAYNNKIHMIRTNEELANLILD